jgi:hypothetical protein
VPQVPLSRTRQPVYGMLRKRGVSLSWLSAEYGIGYPHIRSALNGRVRPSDRLREVLRDKIFPGVPLEAMFDATSLEPMRGSPSCDCDTCLLRDARAARDARRLAGTR